MLVPTVIESTNRGERAYDIFSRLLANRIVFLGTQIDDTSGEIWTKFGVTWQPAFAFISSNGDVDMVKFGDLLNEDQLADRVNALR